jgi:DNA primase
MKFYTRECLEKLSDRVELMEILITFLGSNVIKHVGQGNFEIKCPFCNDSNRSMLANDRFNKFYCFECEASGDAVAFLISHEKMTFENAIKYLANKYEFSLEEATKENSKVTDKDRDDLLDSLIDKLKRQKSNK